MTKERLIELLHRNFMIRGFSSAANELSGRIASLALDQCSDNVSNVKLSEMLKDLSVVLEWTSREVYLENQIYP